MSANKKITPTGMEQADLVEMVYYLWKAHASILSCLVAINSMASTAFSLSASNSMIFNALPTSMTTLTGCSITLV